MITMWLKLTILELPIRTRHRWAKMTLGDTIGFFLAIKAKGGSALELSLSPHLGDFLRIDLGHLSC
jgi:hypothetical protein